MPALPIVVMPWQQVYHSKVTSVRAGLALSGIMSLNHSYCYCERHVLSLSLPYHHLIQMLSLLFSLCVSGGAVASTVPSQREGVWV